MSRTLIALTAIIFVAAAAPASAFSLQLVFPTLTYPTETDPVVSQGCAQPATLTHETCDTTTK
jgi:hypothetical protein